MTAREGRDLISTIEGSKSRGGDILPCQTSSHSYTRWCKVGLETLRRAAPSQTEIMMLTAQTTRPLQKEMVAWRALVRIHLTRTQDPTPLYTMV